MPLYWMLFMWVFIMLLMLLCKLFDGISFCTTTWSKLGYKEGL